MANKLTKLEIDEVSSVPKGAAKTAVLLRKSHHTEDNPMSGDVGVVSIAKRSAQALDEGTLDQASYAKMQQRLAQEQFPGDTIGVALAKFFQTAHGAEMLARGVKKNYADGQMRTALGDGYDVLKAEQSLPRSAADADAPVRGTPAWDGEIQRLMREGGYSRQGAENALRARELRKADESLTIAKNW
jgi:hypothetical protein